MNAHVPQSIQSTVELSEIVAVPFQIVSPQANKPVIGFIQDALLGAFRLTQDHVKLTRDQVVELVLYLNENIIIPKDKLEWSGKEMFSLIIPKDVNYNKQGTVIKDGNLISGSCGKQILGTGSGGLIHIIWKDLGPYVARDFLNNVQKIVYKWLMMDGFSVGISDLFCKQETFNEIYNIIQSNENEANKLIIQAENNKQVYVKPETINIEFEQKIMNNLNIARDKSGSLASNSVSLENRIKNMVGSGSKGSAINIAQIIACVGQQSMLNGRIPYGYQNRTLPNTYKYDLSPATRGFIENSYVSGLTPEEYIFHAMTGREGVIDTAVKSITGDTKLVIVENNIPRNVEIGEWINGYLDAKEHHKNIIFHDETESNMELLDITNMNVYIPTTDNKGKMSWEHITKITRHDPSKLIYKIKTRYGREVKVVESKSLLVWNEIIQEYQPKNTLDVKIGDKVPVSINLMNNLKGDALKQIDYIKMSTYLSPNDVSLLKNNENDFILNKENGFFIGLYLANGLSDIKLGKIHIETTCSNINKFLKKWFNKRQINNKICNPTTVERAIKNNISMTSTCINAYSTVFAKFLTKLVGNTSKNKFIPADFYFAPDEFILGLLDGYIYSHGILSQSSMKILITSPKLTNGISMLLTQFGVFSIIYNKNLMICSKFLTKLANVITITHEEKAWKLEYFKKNPISTYLFNNIQEDTILDTIISIETISSEEYPKVYDLTIPKTKNFGLANGLQVYDTSETGYIQRKLMKHMEDIAVKYDTTIRNSSGNIIQYVYGGDNIDACFIEKQKLDFVYLNNLDFEKSYLFDKSDIQYLSKSVADSLDKNFINVEEFKLLSEFRNYYRSRDINDEPDIVYVPVNVNRIIANSKAINKCSHKKINMSPIFIYETLTKFCNELQVIPINSGISKDLNNKALYATKATIWSKLSSKIIISKHKLCKNAFMDILDKIKETILKAIINPGEMVGAISAQSIGEIQTQLSVIGNTKIIIINEQSTNIFEIGKFIDNLMEKYHNQVVNTHITESGSSQILRIPEEWKLYVPSVSKNEKTEYSRLTEISRHPPNGDLIKITTRTGRMCTATLSHSFLTRKNNQVIEIKGSELKEGDYVPICKNFEQIHINDTLHLLDILNTNEFILENNKIYSNNYKKNNVVDKIGLPTVIKLDKSFGQFIGSVLSDSYIGKKSNTVHFFNIDMSYHNNIKKFAEQYQLLYKKYTDKPRGFHSENEMHVSVIQSKVLNRIAKQCGFGFLDKKVPNWCLNAPEDFISGLIQAYFDGDGNVFYDKHHKTIRAHSSSLELLEGISLLLSRFGIFATLKLHKSQINNRNQPLYEIHVICKYAKLFNDKIGFHIPHKQEYLNKIIEHQNNQKNNQDMIDIIPNFGDVIKNVGEKVKIMHHIGAFHRKNKIGRDVLRNYISKIENKANLLDVDVSNEIQILKQSVDSNLIWDTIINIEIIPSSEHKYVYDFSVKDNENFMLSNGLYVHNTLNTFHNAGISSKTNVTRGVPRFRELIHVSKSPKTPSLTIYLEPPFDSDKEYARSLSKKLEYTTLRFFVKESKIYYDKDPKNTTIDECKSFLDSYYSYYPDEQELSPWCLSLELDPDALFEKQITMLDIYQKMMCAYSGKKIDIIVSDDNANIPMIHIRSQFYNEKSEEFIKKIETIIIDTTICGIYGINRTSMKLESRSYYNIDGDIVSKESWVIETDGNNLIDIFSFKGIDKYNTISNDIKEIADIYGIEAGRMALFHEIKNVMSFYGIYISDRHIELLVDVMTHKGSFMSIDRHGIKKSDAGYLSKMSFEETVETLQQASTFSENDDLSGITANIITGQIAPLGTGICQIVLDEDVFASKKKKQRKK